MQTLNWIKKEEKQILHWQNFQTINITRHFEFWKDYDCEKKNTKGNFSYCITSSRNESVSKMVMWWVINSPIQTVRCEPPSSQLSRRVFSCTPPLSVIEGQRSTAETQLVRNRTSPWLDLHCALRYLLEAVGILHGYFHHHFGRFLNFSAHQEFVQDEISLLKVENDVQLTHLAQTQTHKNNIFARVTEMRLSFTSFPLSWEYRRETFFSIASLWTPGGIILVKKWSKIGKI